MCFDLSRGRQVGFKETRLLFQRSSTFMYLPSHPSLLSPDGTQTRVFLFRIRPGQPGAAVPGRALEAEGGVYAAGQLRETTSAGRPSEGQITPAANPHTHPPQSLHGRHSNSLN